MLNIDGLKKEIAKKENKTTPDFIIEIAGGIFHTVRFPLPAFYEKTWRHPLNTLLVSFATYDKLSRDAAFTPPTKETTVMDKKKFKGFTLRQASASDCKRFLDEINEAIRKFSS